MSRDELIEMILDARSADEIEIAEREADAWLEDHPDDVGIAAACEQLEMMRMASGIDQNLRSRVRGRAARDDRLQLRLVLEDRRGPKLR